MTKPSRTGTACDGNWQGGGQNERDALPGRSHCAEEMFCALRAGICLSFSRHSYSAIGAALDPNGTTELTIASEASGIQASE